jgi:hypothetical protein
MPDTRTISQLEAEGYCRHHAARSVAVDVPSRETLAAFARGHMKRPRCGLRTEAACVGTPAGWVGPRGEGLGQPRFLHSDSESGGLFAAIPLGPLQALILSLRIADGLGQHLA